MREKQNCIEFKLRVVQQNHSQYAEQISLFLR